jgi:hypothetical protein
MPRSEARIFTSIWKDPDFLGLPASAQWLYMFLLSQEELTYCGTIPLRVPRWARKAVGLTIADVELDLKRLEGTAYPSANPDGPPARQPFVVSDSETGELLIRSMLRRDNAWKQPNLLKQARESADQIESRRILGVLLSELQRLPAAESPSEQVRTLIGDFIADLSQGSPYPPAYPTANPYPNPSDDPDGNPSGKDYARARELGERNGSSERLLQAPISAAPTSMSAQARKLGSRLPDDFTVTAEMVAWAREHTPHVDGRRETERFFDHWRAKAGKDGRKLDWVATWRNWMRTAEDRQGPRDRPAPAAATQSTSAQRARQAIEAGETVQAMLDGGTSS